MRSSIPLTTRATRWLWLLGIITAAMTSFYMFRLIFLTFHGDSRVEADKAPHIHESPLVMTIPLMVLAALAVVGGLVGLPEGFLWGNKIGDFLAPSVGEFAPVLHGNFVMLTSASLGLAGLGILLAWYFYLKAPGMPYLIAYQAQSVVRPPAQQVLRRRFLQHDGDAAAVLDIHLRARSLHRLLHDRWVRQWRGA